MNLAAGLRVGKKLGVYQRSRVNDHVRLGKKPCAAHSDEVRRAAPGADKMYHSSALPDLLQ